LDVGFNERFNDSPSGLCLLPSCFLVLCGMNGHFLLFLSLLDFCLFIQLSALCFRTLFRNTRSLLLRASASSLCPRGLDCQGRVIICFLQHHDSLSPSVCISLNPSSKDLGDASMQHVILSKQ